MVDEIGHSAMFDSVECNQQARRVAWLDRMLGDQLFREVIVDIGELHPVRLREAFRGARRRREARYVREECAR